MKKKIYLDDVRTPKDPSWTVVRNYEQFVDTVTYIGLENIDVISLDHDLGDTAMAEWHKNVYHNYELNYDNITEKTGMDCTKWLVNQWLDGAPVVDVVIHSANAVGSGNMMGYINNYRHIHRLPQNCVRVQIEHTVQIMIGGAQPKVLLTQNEDGNFDLDEAFKSIFGKELEPKYKLVRERDQLTKTSVGVKWLEFGEDGRYKADFEDIAVGRSLIMSPFNHSFTWQTTLVTEIVEQRDGYIKFKTENSNYELFKLQIMIWILLLYVLPLVLSILGAYLMVKRDGGSVTEFLEPLPFLFIPLINILFIVAGIYFSIEKWMKNDESVQNFLNKKL